MAVVLIVEDEVFTRQNAGCTIEDLGHSALLACDPGEALAHLTTAGDVDALFVDIRLGGLPLAGFDVAHQAIKLRPQLRVLYTSGSSLTAEMTEQFVGGGRFIQKPYSSDQLESSVSELLHADPL
jgi:CheY-like chemotaxis protein